MKKYAALNDNSKFDFIGNDEPKCPHCGESFNPSDCDMNYLYEEGEHKAFCPKCDERLDITTRVHFTFNTDKKGETA